MLHVHFLSVIVARKFRMPEAAIDLWRNTIISDSAFLADLNIMDYSLLVSKLITSCGCNHIVLQLQELPWALIFL